MSPGDLTWQSEERSHHKLRWQTKGEAGLEGDQELFLGHVEFEMSCVHLGGDAIQVVGHTAQVHL